MRRSGQRTRVQSLLLVSAVLAGATGCAQRPAEPNQNTPATEVEDDATGFEAQATPEPANAAPATAPLGCPSATTSIPGNQLPPPDPKFGGVINVKATDSKPWWPPRIVPPKGAPTCC